MIRGAMTFSLLAGCLQTAAAADLLQEVAWSGPQSADYHPLGDSLWELGARLDASATSDTRSHGLLAVQRSGDPLDGQATLSLTRNTGTSREFDMTYNWLRVGVRGGTDPLSAASGKASGSAFVGWCGPLLISTIGEIGHSAERGTVTSGEVSLFVIRAAGERDDTGHWTSLGTGPRFIGSDLPLAGGVTADHVWQFTDGADWSGNRYALWVEWRFSTHFQIAAHGQLSTGVHMRPGTTEDVAQGTISSGWAW